MEIAYKLILLGDSSVGKTAIVNRRTYNRFDELLPMTVGVSNFKIVENIRGNSIELKIWDTAGQEQYSSLIPMFSRNSDVCILVCDIISPSSIKNLGEWEKRLKDSGCDPPIIVAVNKIDLDPNFEEHFFEMAPKIMEHFPDIMFVSALSGSGIHELFRLAAEKATEYDSRHDPNDRKKKPKTINPANNDGSSEKGCC